MIPDFRLRAAGGAPTDLLSPTDAALLLGVTPELLYAYAVKGVRVAGGPVRRLPHTSQGGRDGFTRGDLVAYDAYLREYWADESATRPPVPPFVSDYLKVESGGACARCRKGHKLENAHIIPYTECRSHHHHNLIRLCTECHEALDSKALLRREVVLELKNQLVARMRDRLSRGNGVGNPGIGRMPNAASQLVGRDEEVGAIVEALESSRTVSIEGPGGIGKTQLAITALTRFRSDRPIIWINVEAYRTVEDLQIALRAALPEPIQGPLENLLTDLDAQLVFDGVEQMDPGDMDDLEDFLQHLIRGTRAPRFLFTSQASLLNLDIGTRIVVGPISSDASQLLLQAPLNGSPSSAAETRSLRWLISFCSGHPLTVYITAALLRYFGSAVVVQERIRREQAAALENPTRRRHNRQTSLPVCLLVSYGILSRGERRTLWFASQCPAGYLTGVAAHPGEECDREEIDATARLAYWHLVNVERLGEGLSRLHVLSPIRVFVKQQWEQDGLDEVQEMETELATSLTYQAMILDQRYLLGNQEQVAYGIARFDMEFGNYIECLKMMSRADTQPRFQELASALASSLMVYCFVRGLSEQGARILRVGVNAALRGRQFGRASELLTRLVALADRASDLELLRAASQKLDEIAQRTNEPVHSANAASARVSLALHEGRLEDAVREGEAAAAAYARCASEFEPETEEEAGEFGLPITNWAAHIQAMSTKQLAFAYMKAKRFPEALLHYEQALKWIDLDKDWINRGSVLHQIGNCAGELGQMERALASYLEAAKCFAAIGMEEYISNSLSELGWLLVDWDPPQSPDAYIDTDQLVLGLEDAARQLLRAFPQSKTPLPESSVPTIRKLLGLVALASFSSRNKLLIDWADNIITVIFLPLMEQLVAGERRVEDAWQLTHLELTLMLALGVAAEVQVGGNGPQASNEEVEWFTQRCYYFGPPGWSCFRPFNWLATYLRRHRSTPVTAEALRQAAEDAVRTGTFRSPGRGGCSGSNEGAG